MRALLFIVALAAGTGCDVGRGEAPPQEMRLAKRLEWCRESTARSRTDFCLDAEREEERRFIGGGASGAVKSFRWGGAGDSAGPAASSAVRSERP